VKKYDSTHANEPSDQVRNTDRLVAASRNGDQRAYHALYRQFERRIYSLAFRFAGGDAALAADWTQDAFVRAWQRLDQFQHKSSFGTWLYRLATNVCLSGLRKRERSRVAAGACHDIESLPAQPQDDPLDLEAAVTALPERARTVLLLHDVEGYRHREIASMLNIATGTSKAHLHRARSLLREMLA